jgi:GcrA cell cycle regulator
MTARTDFALIWMCERRERCVAKAFALSAAQEGRGRLRRQLMNTGEACAGTPCTGTATWTTERVEQLRSYVTAGLTCSQIAGEIGATRNAVIGKIHRMGLSPTRPRGRPSALAQRMGSTPARPRRAPTRLAQILRACADATTITPFETTTAMMELPGIDSVRRCSLLDLTSGDCRWPLGDPTKDDFGFCGNESIAGISYCAGHARLAYRLPSGRRA